MTRATAHDPDLASARDAARLLELADRVDAQREVVVRAARKGCRRGSDVERLTIFGSALAEAERAFAGLHHPGLSVHAIGGVVVAAQRTGDCWVVFERTPQVVAP